MLGEQLSPVCDLLVLPRGGHAGTRTWLGAVLGECHPHASSKLCSTAGLWTFAPTEGDLLTQEPHVIPDVQAFAAHKLQKTRNYELSVSLFYHSWLILPSEEFSCT